MTTLMTSTGAPWYRDVKFAQCILISQELQICSRNRLFRPIGFTIFFPGLNKGFTRFINTAQGREKWEEREVQWFCTTLELHHVIGTVLYKFPWCLARSILDGTGIRMGHWGKKLFGKKERLLMELRASPPRRALKGRGAPPITIYCSCKYFVFCNTSTFQQYLSGRSNNFFMRDRPHMVQSL